MTLRVAVDFGTSSTCVVASINGRDPQVVVVDGQPLMSSAVYAAADGTLFVGQEAERQAAVDPSRYEPNPKRRIDEGDLLLGDSVLRVADVVHAVLRRAVTEARVLAGSAEVNLLVLTHPADWGAIRTRLLRQAAGRLAAEVVLVPEPVAAAVYHATTFAPSGINVGRTVEFGGKLGDTLAVLDLGGGTVDVSVVRRLPSGGPERPNQSRPGGFQVLATRGDPSFGGVDIDQALLEHVGSLVASADPDAWRQLVEGRELIDRRRRRALRQDVRGAKETLSRHAYADVPMPRPFADGHVTRVDLERLVAAPLGRAVELTRAAIDEAGVRPEQLTAIFLVGGSSRIPMLSRLVHERIGIVPTTLDQPETVVARGALRVALIAPHRAGAQPATAAIRVETTSAAVEQRTEVPLPIDVTRQTPSFVFPPASPTASRAAFSGLNAARRTSRGKRSWLIGGAAIVVAAVAGGLIIMRNGGAPQPEGRAFAQYDYRFIAPFDWAQTGDNVADKQVVIHPADAQTADDLVVVQEFSMDFDATADRPRLIDYLRGLAAQNAEFSGFTPDATYAGKSVIHYRQAKDIATTDWYVVVRGRTRVHVACQYSAPALAQRVRGACEQVVRTLAIGG